ncbi:MAG: peptidase [Pseudomonadota bacterium]
MTYCLALNLDQGLILLADSRTNAGVDDISVFGKLFTWSLPGAADSGGPEARTLGLMTAGSLSITQEIVALTEEEIDTAADGVETIATAPSMFRVAEAFGAKMRDVQNRRGPQLAAAGVSSAASMIVAGKIGAGPGEIFLIYQAGNFIEATRDTPFLQIGETKYGKVILDRVLTAETPLSDGVKAALLSMDGTVRSNLSVGAPFDLAVSATGAHGWLRRRIEADDPVYKQLSDQWSDQLRAGFMALPELPLTD